ncbi:glycoside hydrolase family 76 protein [Teratosphaeria destructans]|uniref:Glycoside hydrolase family 76 protein n=1 Tax=Teratosphaeria destructans TaxID=418781 RepID=A0A9W7SSD3_9PEZI|nr:glycoside hydrolase family 76 protein [Teratosphaeria destructans]
MDLDLDWAIGLLGWSLCRVAFGMYGRIVALLGLSSRAAAVTFGNAESAYGALQQWYNESNGLWVPSTGWWNSANCLTVISDLAMIDDPIRADVLPIYENTWVRAQQYNLQMGKQASPPLYLPESYYTDGPMAFPSGFPIPPVIICDGFLNSYYDDEGWWALAWIAAYDVTSNPQYLATAEDIFEDIKASYDTTPCGGVWWDKAHTYVNSIANELFLDVAAHLANRVALRSEYYLGWAQEEWRWFQRSGLINAQHTINDGLNDSTCQNNNGTVWSYNQGVILGGLTELARATRDTSYVTTAKQIADAALAALAPSGILHDPCEPDCGGDGSQFKGVFARNLQILQQYAPETRYQTFLDDNAESIWARDRSGSELDLIWSGGNTQPANASTQSSALDALVGSLAT